MGKDSSLGSVADAATLAEARRIHANVCELRLEHAQHMSQQFEEVRAAGFWPGFSMLLGIYSSDCLLEGLGWYALHDDLKSARDAFDAGRVVLPYYAEVQAIGSASPLTRKTKYSEEEFRRTFGSARNFEAALLCAILANDQETAIRLARLVADERLIWDGFEDHHDIFVRHLAAVLRGEAASISMEDYNGARGSKSFWINPYREPLVAFARGDRRAISAARCVFEESYRARGRARDSTHLAFGASNLGQAMSFDAIGAALLRIASWAGEPPAAGSRFHPAAFI